VLISLFTNYVNNANMRRVRMKNGEKWRRIDRTSSIIVIGERAAERVSD
jgi:hypothetical protein